MVVSASVTTAGGIPRYSDLMSAATPATSAQAGLVPSTEKYWPLLPCAGIFLPGAATLTDRLPLENEVGSPVLVTAPTLITPGYSAGKDTGAMRLERECRVSLSPELPADATRTTPFE